MKARTRIALDVAALSAVAAGLGWLSVRYRRDVRCAGARVLLGGRVIDTACGAVEYGDFGAGSTLLAIHGAGGGYDQGLAVAGPLADYGFRVIAPSRFGYLRTPVPDHPSLALQAEAHACLLDALALPNAAVLGVSAGAPSAVEFALRHPERCTHLILLVPAAAGPLQAASGVPLTLWLVEKVLATEFVYWAISRLAPGFVQKSVLGTPRAALATASESERRRAARILRDLSPLSQRQAGLFLEPQLIDETRTQAVEEIVAPTLAVSAQDDGYRTYENARRIAARVRHGRFLGYRTGGHLLVGHNSEVIAEIAAFLKEPAAGPEKSRSHARKDFADAR